MQAVSSLLLALQYGDTAFPAGGFAQSWGLETGVFEHAIHTAGDMEGACRAALRFQVARTDAVAAAGCCRLASSAPPQVERIIAIDQRLTATRTSRETREASLRTGRRLIEVATANEGDTVLAELQAAVLERRADGNHAVMLGAIASRGGLTPEAAAVLTLWGASNALLGAGVRLLPLTHSDVQSILVRLRPMIAELAIEASAGNPLTMGGAVPLFEIWSMRHETATVRLFAS